MKCEEIINNWKDHRSQIEVGKNFTDDVMNQIYQYEQKKEKSLFDVQRLINLISAHSLAQAGLIATGALIGFFRLVFMIGIILGY